MSLAQHRRLHSRIQSANGDSGEPVAEPATWSGCSSPCAPPCEYHLTGSRPPPSAALVSSLSYAVSGLCKMTGHPRRDQLEHLFDMRTLALPSAEAFEGWHGSWTCRIRVSDRWSPLRDTTVGWLTVAGLAAHYADQTTSDDHQ